MMISTLFRGLPCGVFMTILVAGFITFPVQAVEVIVKKETCLDLVEYQPDASVRADYQVGVDARGNAVAPADLGGSYETRAPESYTFDLDVLMGETTENILGGTQTHGDGSFGTVTFDSKTGEVLYNGEPLSEKQVDAVTNFCADAAVQEALKENPEKNTGKNNRK